MFKIKTPHLDHWTSSHPAQVYFHSLVFSFLCADTNSFSQNAYISQSVTSQGGRSSAIVKVCCCETSHTQLVGPMTMTFSSIQCIDAKFGLVVGPRRSVLAHERERSEVTLSTKLFSVKINVHLCLK